MYPSLAFGPLALSTWRLVVVCGVVLCWPPLIARLKRMGYDSSLVLLMVALALPVGVVGGHLFERLIPWALGMPPDPDTGLTVVGSMAAVLAFMWLFAWRVMKAPLAPLLDGSAFTLPLAMFIGRFGCWLNGCCFGAFAPDWAARGPVSLLTIRAGAYVPMSFAGRLLKDAPPDRPLWNLPLLLMLNSLCVLAVSESLFRRRERLRLTPGTVGAAMLAQEIGGRFCMEFLRWDTIVPGTSLNPWQASLIPLFLGALGALAFCLHRRDQAAPGAIPAL